MGLPREVSRIGDAGQPLFGIFACVSGEGVGFGGSACDYTLVWQAPIADWWEPRCPLCAEPAALVEVVGTRFGRMTVVDSGRLSTARERAPRNV
jgi:hypothetical protein